MRYPVLGPPITMALDFELGGVNPVPSRICTTVLSNSLIACNFFTASSSSLTMRTCCSSSRSSQTDSKVPVSCMNLVTEKSTFLPSAVVVVLYRSVVGTRSGIASLAIICKAAIVRKRLESSLDSDISNRTTTSSSEEPH